MVGKKPGQETTKASFNEVAKMTFGKGWATRLFDVRLSYRSLVAIADMVVRHRHQVLRCIGLIPYHL
jgi:hypothetical protein